jgi:hypothetical protein
MKRRKRSGTVLTLVILALGLVAALMLVLAEGATTMLHQADAAYLRAVQRNLTASGLAWAQHEISDANEPPHTEPAQLDVDPLSERSAELTVRVVDGENGEATVHIVTTCTKARQTVRSEQDYTIPSP